MGRYKTRKIGSPTSGLLTGDCFWRKITQRIAPVKYEKHSSVYNELAISHSQILSPLYNAADEVHSGQLAYLRRIDQLFFLMLFMELRIRKTFCKQQNSMRFSLSEGCSMYADQYEN